MRGNIIDAFRKIGVEDKDEIKEFIEKSNDETFTRKQVNALEIAHRQKLISEAGHCYRCNRTDMLTTDHVIPKTLLVNFGVDVERTFMPENLILLCRPCNSLKADMLDFSIPQTKMVLLDLLAKL